jgi:16S rRNA G966 N2-methylase RsmD
VEKSRRAAQCIRHNLSHAHLEDYGQVIVAEAFAFLHRAGSVEGGPTYDLLLADPPYHLGYSERLLEALAHSRLLNAGAVAVLEETARLQLEPETGKLRCFLRRVVGETALHFYEVS